MGHEEFVTEVMRLRGTAMMTNLAEVQAAIHLSLSPKASHTLNPLDRPSSWKP